ncbi:hydroxypyruvate isomerase family protein [Parapedobacter sp. 10938]|uniref:hydroxypyruvate isomerase family protein n=1 Tax=Parapedobacter flavus TaxID=3110225 RepID=UPI002DB689A2|nr:TIM barrel protein [Parapedobacter sp. 10938]MEC3880822.1 TIM barrel protein [Parapedobacter sp. 10938]
MKSTPPLFSRRSALKAVAAGTTAVVATGMFQRVAATEKMSQQPLKGRINHSVCRWCYPDVPLAELCAAAKEMGITAIDLVGPKEWPVLKQHGLHAAMPHGAGKGITDGFNDPSLHDELVASYEKLIPQVAAAGYDQLICFSGNRRGLDDEQGIRHCATGLKRLMGTAEKHRVTLVMELLNSKVDHPDYQCDHTAWGAALCDAVGSERFKLLYDIYHMQIMEGDVIATIRKYHPYIAHYHTGGVPGRNEIDESQELHYPAIMRAIVETGFTGYVAQEFIPKKPEPLKSLAQAIAICDV